MRFDKLTFESWKVSSRAELIPLGCELVIAQFTFKLTEINWTVSEEEILEFDFNGTKKHSREEMFLLNILKPFWPFFSRCQSLHIDLKGLL